ncbi:MAG: replication initiation factor domain-containing protein, partial [Cyanobacteria bacterium]|nr:replication initiation factor domain-containing protein [Cyanobacteriota bacterium]
MKVYSSPSLDFCSVEIPGQAADCLDFEKLRHWYAWLRDIEQVRLRFSRADIFFDGAPFTPRMAYDAFLAGDVRTWAKRTKYRWEESFEGNTFYCGSRDSERFLRIYDKRGPTRVELELAGERADMVMWDIIEAANVAETMLGHIRAYIDFVDSASDSNLSRAAHLPWWAAFVELASKSLLVVPVAQKTLQQVRAYVERTWSGMFATLNEWRP